jgi:hypothetical protein
MLDKSSQYKILNELKQVINDDEIVIIYTRSKEEMGRSHKIYIFSAKI